MQIDLRNSFNKKLRELEDKDITKHFQIGAPYRGQFKHSYHFYDKEVRKVFIELQQMRMEMKRQGYALWNEIEWIK